MSNEIDENLIISLNAICGNLLTILNKTENVLQIEKEKYKQVRSICEPWPVKNKRSTEDITNLECTCSSTQVVFSEPTDSNTVLVDNIPNIVNKTKALRINPSKNSITKFSNAKKSIKDAISVKGKSKNLSKSSKTSIKSKAISSKTNFTKSSVSMHTSSSKTTNSVGMTSHDPSCALYSLKSQSLNKTQSFSNLSEAVSAYGVPSSLNKTLKDYYKFVLGANKTDNITQKAKNNFLKNFHKENEASWNVTITEVDKLSKYMSALHSVEEKLVKPSPLPCVIYRNIEDLVTLEEHKAELYEKELWNDILLYIKKQFIPNLYCMELTDRQKIYVCKILSAICNYTESRIPNVPVFRIKE